MVDNVIDPYEAVLADLRAKREQIDNVIKSLESLKLGGQAPTALGSSNAASAASIDGPGVFLGMSIPDASIKLLAARKRTMSNSEIAAAIQAGGLALTSAEPSNTVGSVLTRRFMKVGDVVRVGRGIWGLKEWYPNRNFRQQSKAAPGSPLETELPIEIGDVPDVDLPDETVY